MTVNVRVVTPLREPGSNVEGLTMAQLNIAGKRLLSVEETGVYLGLSPRTLSNGKAPKTKKPFPIKAKRVGKLVKFDIKDLERYVDSL